MRERHDDKTLRYRFDSLQEVQRYIEATPRVWHADASQSEEACDSWDLNAGYEGALKLARDGWRDGGKELRSAMVRLPQMKPAPEMVYSTDGIQVDIGRVCAHIPECMLRPSPDAYSGAHMVISLVVAINALASVSARCMANYGAAIARYIDELEAQGHQVELTAGCVSTVSGKRVAVTWLVKSAGDTMNLATVAFSIGHPAAFRRFGFALRERVPSSLLVETRAYGHSTDITLKDLINPQPGTIILNGMCMANSLAPTPEAALVAVSRQIEAAMSDPEAATVAA